MSQQSVKGEQSPASLSQETSFGDIDSFLDFDNNSSSLIASPPVRRSPFPSSTPSSAESPSMNQSTPEFPAPSHPYNLHVQQTDIIGLDMSDGFYGNNTSFMQVDQENGLASTPQTSLPPYFFPEQTTTAGSEAMSQGISPMMTIGEISPPSQKMDVTPATHPVPRPPTQRMNYYPGYHQEMAAYNQNMRALEAQQKFARQKAIAAVSRAPPHPQQAKINAVLDSFKSPTPANPPTKSPGEILPHIARMKKEEEEMDDDERLLASEEGKKLSSKERRQLRNKVSARAFRSRRKEYISQLEAEVAKKTQEAEGAKDAQRRLEEENARLRGFSEMLMKHPAFQEFIKDMTVPLTNPVPAASQPHTEAIPPAAVVETMPTFNPTRDANPNVTSSEEQWPLAYTSWPNASSHVYTVDVPELPAIQDLDGKVTFEEDYPVADGFFSSIRNEKADIDFSRLHEEEETTYQPPENIEDLFIEEEREKKSSLDELFPGVGVNSLLDKLELIAGGEAKPEDLFDMEKKDLIVATEGEPLKPKELAPKVCRSNVMLREADGVYRRIGLAVGEQ